MMFHRGKLWGKASNITVVDRKRGRELGSMTDQQISDFELYLLATDIIKTIEREDAFYESRKNGGFVESIKAKETKEVFLWR